MVGFAAIISGRAAKKRDSAGIAATWVGGNRILAKSVSAVYQERHLAPDHPAEPAFDPNPAPKTVA
jgi:hypothetical protein